MNSHSYHLFVLSNSKLLSLLIQNNYNTCLFQTGVCTSEEIYGENSYEVAVLRDFRDNVLSQTPAGQEIIELYYQWSPAIVRAMEADEEFKEDIKEMIDGVLEIIE